MTDEERSAFQTALLVALRTELGKQATAAGLRLSTFDVTVTPAGTQNEGRIVVEFKAHAAAQPAQVARSDWVEQPAKDAKDPAAPAAAKAEWTEQPAQKPAAPEKE